MTWLWTIAMVYAAGLLTVLLLAAVCVVGDWLSGWRFDREVERLLRQDARSRRPAGRGR